MSLQGCGTTALVVGGGACTSIGATLPASAAAARAGIATFGHHPYMIDTAGKPMVVGPLPYLPIDMEGAQRWLAMALPAAREALVALPLELAGKLAPIAVLLGLPEPRPGLSPDIAHAFPAELAAALRQVLPIGEVACLQRGHAAGLLALQAGMAKIERGEAELCLVGGVDSLLDPETLEWLESSAQLHSAGDNNNAWGFIPSEGAGFCLLASPRLVQELDLPVKCRIAAVGLARERCLIKTDTVCTGLGLTEAFQEVLRDLRPAHDRIDHIVCDMNGEPYRAEEFGFASLRTHDYFVDSAHYVAPSDCWGDVGAASGPLFVNLAIEAFAKGYRPGRRTLVWASSEGGDRAAAIVDFAQ